MDSKLAICLLIAAVAISNVASQSILNKTERIKKFRANAKNPGDLEYIRQGLQKLRNQQQQEPQPPVNPADLQYIENLTFLQKSYDKNASTNLYSPSMEEVNAGLEDYLFESDILLTPSQIDEMLNPRKKRQASIVSNRWDKTRPIYYTFDASLGAAIPPLFRQAARFWTENTCLNLVESSALPNIRVFAGTGEGVGSPCYSGLGFYGSNSISLGSGCEYFGVVIHELAHTLGIRHEQKRFDRDSYITMIPENMDAFYTGQFIKETSLTTSNYGQPYDWGSVMHYRDRGSDGKIYAIARDRIYQPTMGNRYAPTFKDIYLMNLHYNCLCTTGALCWNGGFRNPKNCNACICPSGFGGTLCNQRQPAENGAIDTGAILGATTTLQTLTGKTGDRLSILRYAQAVHWQITAPAGKQIEITIQSVTGQCHTSCFWGSLEVKVGNFAITGARYCCTSHIAANPILISTRNFAIISVYSLAYEHSFTLKYRYINAPPTTTTTTTKTTQKPCFDIANNCVTNIALCTNTLYYDLMKEKCQKTCRYCSSTQNCFDVATNCITNSALCYNTLYRQLMAEKCQRTCGLC